MTVAADTARRPSRSRALTTQARLFPMRCVDGESFQDYERRLQDQQFAVADDLLYQCITYGDGLDAQQVKGFTDSKGLGYSLLVFFVERALGLRRLPHCSDRAHSGVLRPDDVSRYSELIKDLSLNRIDAICAEVRALYEHTQRQLASKGIATVTLRRCVDDRHTVLGGTVGYAEQLFRLASACATARRTHLRYVMDVLNSYGDDGSYNGRPVAIIHDIPAEDVFYCSNLVKNRGSGAAVETGEWVVINRSPTGVVTLPVEAIVTNPGEWRSTMPASWTTRDDAEAFVKHFEPVELKGEWPLRLRVEYRAGAMRMRWRRRVQVALQVLRTGRYPWTSCP